MNRLAFFISLLFICACTKKIPIPPLPETLSGGWHRTELRAEGANKWRAGYDGPGVVHLQIFGVTSGGAGLDMVQKWPAAPNTVTFYTERYFTVVQWERADRDALRLLIGRLQKALEAS